MLDIVGFCKRLLIKVWAVFSFVTGIKRKCRVVCESPNFIVINKGFDLKINSNDMKEETVQTFLKKKYPKLASKELFHEYYFVHRLDYSTSGVMCIPVHKKACQAAARCIQSRGCSKYYVALARGFFSLDFLDLDLPIGRDEEVTEIEKMCVNDSNSSRTARTLIAVLEKGLYDNYPTTKILVRPVTGRRHQIRVHCSHIGHTLVGDYTYSNRKDTTPSRMFLHSIKLVLPTAIESLSCETEDPFVKKNISDWQPLFHLYSLQEAFRELDTMYLNIT